MKIIKSLCALAALSLGLAASAQTRPLAFTWSYTNSTIPDSFVLFSTTDLATPLTNWSAIAQIPCPVTATNVSTNQGLVMTNYTLSLVTNYSAVFLPAQRYFTVAASNIWGFSPFSNVAGTPGVAGNSLALIIK
jgi:hypothetical protein